MGGVFGTVRVNAPKGHLPMALKKTNAKTARPKLPPNIQTRNALPAAAITGARMRVLMIGGG